MIKAIIIEDEAQSRNNLKNILANQCPSVNIIAEAGSIADGLKIIKKYEAEIDLAFLDISLKDGLVFQLLDQLKEIKFDIIFVTAFEEYAKKACSYSSIGYVVKPIDADELQEAVGRIRPGNENQINERLELFKNFYENPNTFHKITISTTGTIHFVNLSDIIRFEGDDNYTRVFLKTKPNPLLVPKTMRTFEDSLRNANFFRVHQSHIVNLNYINKYIKGNGGYLLMDNSDEKITVSRRRRREFLQRIKALESDFK